MNYDRPLANMCSLFNPVRKLILQEGEKMVDVSGSLVVTLVLLPFEESSYATFERSLDRPCNEPNGVVKAIHVSSFKNNHDPSQSEINSASMKSKEHDSQIISIVKVQKGLRHRISEKNLERKRLEKEKHPWFATEKQLFGRKGSDYDFASRDPSKAQEEFEKLEAEQSDLEKRVNKKVMAMFEKAKDEYNDLISKKNNIENDKSKIKLVIEELDEKKEALKVTWVKVNKRVLCLLVCSSFDSR
ncbi:unnamed protein product [Fraxinus pennsylvanica]|uniref:Uncharacterized protein n=1 Tax=Fraxinus pennsylvanica TaxID=56036 RepID=A0AAD2AE39_9LAMI|nr:unnamed protein product [Fraxinus pennsylvanica]